MSHTSLNQVKPFCALIISNAVRFPLLWNGGENPPAKSEHELKSKPELNDKFDPDWNTLWFTIVCRRWNVSLSSVHEGCVPLQWHLGQIHKQKNQSHRMINASALWRVQPQTGLQKGNGGFEKECWRIGGFCKQRMNTHQSGAKMRLKLSTSAKCLKAHFYISSLMPFH